MKTLITLFFVVFLSFQSIVVWAQKTNDGGDDIEQKIEDLVERYDLNLDFSDILDALMYYHQNPLNLNEADADALKSLLILDPIQIQNLLTFIDKNGLLQSPYDLKDISGFSYTVIRDLMPFIRVAPIAKDKKFPWKKVMKYGRNDIILRYGRVLESQEGYLPISDSALTEKPNSRYEGSQDKLYLRYRFTFQDKISVGLLGDKDAGESFFKASNPAGFDFYSAHAYIKDLGRIKKIALGDYHLESGQGLALWSGLGFGKSVDVMGVQKLARGLRPNTSANERLYFRGVATTISIYKGLEFTAFYSRKKLDASLNIDSSDAEQSYFESIQETGFHRTASEIEKKKVLGEQLFGGMVQYNKAGLHLGATAYQSQFDHPWEKSLQLYQQFDFQGDRNFNGSVDFSYTASRFSSFGEWAMSKNGGMAVVVGLLGELTPRVKTSIVYRQYARDYQVMYAVPFGESAKAQNETALFWGASFYLGKRSNIRLYYDLFSFPWMRYRVDAPSQGAEFLAQWDHYTQRNFQFYFRVKSENKMLNSSDGDAQIHRLEEVLKQSARLHLSYSPLSSWYLKSRVEVSSYKTSSSDTKKGYLLYQDVNYRPQNHPFDFSFRYAIFNSEDYDSRIYAYEQDVLYKFSIPAYYYQGQRMYLLFHWDVKRGVDFWLRYSVSNYFNRDQIGTALETIDGNSKSEVGAQIRWKF